MGMFRRNFSADRRRAESSSFGFCFLDDEAIFLGRKFSAMVDSWRCLRVPVFLRQRQRWLRALCPCVCVSSNEELVGR